MEFKVFTFVCMIAAFVLIQNTSGENKVLDVLLEQTRAVVANATTQLYALKTSHRTSPFIHSIEMEVSYLNTLLSQLTAIEKGTSNLDKFTQDSIISSAPLLLLQHEEKLADLVDIVARSTDKTSFLNYFERLESLLDRGYSDLGQLTLLKGGHCFFNHTLIDLLNKTEIMRENVKTEFDKRQNFEPHFQQLIELEKALKTEIIQQESQLGTKLRHPKV